MSVYLTRLMDAWSYKNQFLCPLQWETITCTGTPSMRFHTGVIIGGNLYVHGGSSDEHQFSEPVNTFYRFHIKKVEWVDLSKIPDSPALSNHASVALFDRYFITIGGWNGKNCESKVRIFDTKKEKWITINPKGLPEDMQGLACHSVNLISPRGKNPEFLILASNTSIRRHHILAFRLTPDETLEQWTFHKLPNRGYLQLNQAVACVGGDFLYSIGGNFSKLLQKLLVYDVVPDPQNKLVSSLMTYVADNRFNSFSNMAWFREACRGHCAISGKNGFIFLNGVNCCTSTVDFRKNVYAYLELGSRKGFYYVGEIKEQLAFGVCACNPNTGISYYHGGISHNNEEKNKIYYLSFFFEEARRGFMCQREVVTL